MSSYSVNEIFYSIQGEGANAGKPAVFVRFSGCNLKCPFCDTDFKEHRIMSQEEIVEEMERVNTGSCTLCVLTGGEPTLQYDEALATALRKAGYIIAMESNGTIAPAAKVDFLTISPKTQWEKDATLKVRYHVDEIKLVVDKATDLTALTYYEQRFTDSMLFIQPCDTGFIKENKEIISRCVEFLKNHPQWRLSLQQQKIINVR